MVTKNTSKSNVGKVVAITAGIAALSAGAYLLFGPDAKKNQKKVKGWMVKMKGDIIEKMEQAKDITAPIFANIVEEVSAQYSKMKDMDAKQVDAAARSIKREWKGMAAHLQKSGSKKIAKAKKKLTKKVMKKKITK